MEYRLRYRDIPWHMVVFIPVGKIVGRCILAPFEYLVRYPARVFSYIFRKFCLLSLVALLLGALLLVIDLSIAERKLGIVDVVRNGICTVADCRTNEEKVLDHLAANEELERQARARLDKQKADKGEYEEHRLKRNSQVKVENMPAPKPKEKIVAGPSPERRGF